MSLPTDTKVKEYFYRYRHFDDDECKKSLERLLSRNEMILSSPASFNDPYDCRLHYTTAGTERQKRAYFKNMSRLIHPEMSKGEVNAYAVKFLKRYNRPETNFDELFKEAYYERACKSFGMVCLTKVPDNILMWSHYASSHSGICLQFESNLKTSSIFWLLKKVYYTQTYPVVDFTTAEEDEIITKGFLTKAIDWEYENEYRYFCDATEKKIVIPEESLTGIIFGLSTSPKNKGFICDLIQSRKTKPVLYQTKMKNGQYGIDIVRAT